jgi:RHS repeat-associated protein
MFRRKTGEKSARHFYVSKYYEREVDTTDREYHYIYGAQGVVALYVTTAPVDTTTITNPGDLPTFEAGDRSNDYDSTAMYYIHTDHLGSYCAITDENKEVVQRNIFDPWGNHYYFQTHHAEDNPQLEAGDTTRSVSFLKLYHFNLTKRGFTGHEHYPELKIINMNGRLYDPVIGRFFSPDNFVQMPEFTQAYNRYSYCLNNPLKYIDPTGWRYHDVDDIYDFDHNGKFLGRTEANFDQIRVLNKDNTVYAESKKYDKGFFDNVMTFGETSINISGKGLQNLEGLSMDFGVNLDAAMAAFRFLDKHTSSEWTAFGRNNYKGGMDNILSTTHKPDFEYFGSRMAEFAAPNGNLFYNFHSHKTSMFPSNRISNKYAGDKNTTTYLFYKSLTI